MKRNIKLFFSSILITALLMTLGITQSTASSGTTSKLQKVIAVVLDDSGSMVRDGTRKEDYTTRWVEADYAVRALAAMMDSDDILRVYPLNAGRYFSVTIGKNDIKTELFSELDSVKYSGGTKFSQVKEAAEYLNSVQNRECYLVVITDGNFQNDDGSNMSQTELDEAFAEILTPAIKTHYIQIGGLNSKSILPTNSGISIHYEAFPKITKQITDVINEIYHRVAMEDKDKESLITYLSEGDLTVGFNIPIKSATIFLQGNADWANAQYSTPRYATESTEISRKPRDTLRLWDELGPDHREWIKTIELSGLVINCSATDGGLMESVTVSGVLGLDKDSIQVYYQPAVEQQVTITQRDGISFIYGRLDPPLFVEGPIDIAIDYQSMDGKALDLNVASMLKSESTAVEVNGRLFSGTRQEDGRYVYSGVLSAADVGSSIVISNAIGLNEGKRLIPLEEIYEPNMSLALELAQDSIELILDDTGSTVLSVVVSNEAAGVPPEWKPGMEVHCTSEHLIADEDSFIYEDGVVRIPIALKDVEEHQIAPTERFTVNVSIPYSDSIRPPELVERTFPTVLMTSEPHELSVELENTSVELIYVATLGKTFSITYNCDGKPLSEKQMQDAVLSLTLQDADLDNLVTLENREICLKSNTLQWLNIRNGEYEAELTFSYTKWNQPAQISIPITLRLSPITWWHIICFIVVVLALIALFAFLIWFGFWYFKWTKTKNGDYIKWNTTFELINRDDPTGRTQLIWSWYSKLLFRANFWGKRYAHIRRSVLDKADDGPLPGRIDFYVAREGDHWKLGKIGKRMKPALDECDLRIGDVPVSNDNCRFLAGDDFQNRLELKRPNQAHPWYLRITEDE